MINTQSDKSRGTPLSKRGYLYKGPFPQDGGYSVNMKVGVFIIAALYNDVLLFFVVAELSEALVCAYWRADGRRVHAGFL